MADEPKRCRRCQTVFAASHWAHGRTVCPSCGGSLEPATAPVLRYEHYDSSADIRFDLAGLLSPEQKREAWIVCGLGGALIVLAFAARLAFLILGGLKGFWGVPWWFDVLVGGMILLGAGMGVWATVRLLRHWRTLRRR